MRISSHIVALVLTVLAASAGHALDFSGDISLQARGYPQSAAFAGQRSATAGVVLKPTLQAELAGRTSFTLTPLYRYDSADPRRTYADLREAYLLMHGDWDGSAWEFRFGMDRVFWGVAEVYNLVDIVNQTDLIEHPRDRPKLGQPMAALSLSGDWGRTEAIVLPYHRKRSYPGRHGRARARYLVDTDAEYESGANERHMDLALRYSHSVGRLDFGLTTFDRTSREPLFLASMQKASPVAASPSLISFYEQIRQFGIDAQLTTEAWLYKLEAIQRRGARNLLGREENYSAFILGLEHTQYALCGTRADLTVFGEWLYDDRGNRATTTWDNDLYLAGFLALNDVQGTEFTAGLLADLRRETRVLNLEAKRRLSGNWSMRLEAFVNLQTDREDLGYDVRRDSFLGADLTYGF